MDTVRFGRVLGHGARQAAKTLVAAADAATAANPNPPRPAATPASAPPRPLAPRPSASSETISSPSAVTSPPPSPPPVGTILPPSTPRTQPATSTRGLAEGSRRFGRAVWAPAVRLSGVLWLELTGVFFGLFALVAAIAAWHLRSALHTLAASPGAPASDDRSHLLFAVGMIVVFGYFSLSSFLKANRRSRKP